MRGRRALAEVVRALNRGMRSMGYYDPSHPVFEAARKEAFDRLQSLWDDASTVTLGGAGHHLVIDTEGGVLDDEPARAFAGRLFEASVVALRFGVDAGPEDLGRTLEALAERPERIRAAGGVRALLEGWGVGGVEVFEVDFGALFAGEVAELGPLVGQDPVAEIALKEVLRLEEDAGGAAAGRVGVSFERLDDPDSLGAFLDELLDDASPQAVEGGAGFLTADDVADQAAQAYLRGQTAASKAGAPEAQLRQSANVLAGALVRLSPEARFALLRKLAGGDEAGPSEQVAAARLGERLDDDLVRSTVAAALVEHPDDPDVVRAVGNVIRRLRPVEARRQALLSSLDEAQAAAGRPLDGVIWQQIRARAEEDPGLGMMEVALTRHRDRLHAAMIARLREGPDYPGMDVVHSAAPAVVEHWSARALADLLAGSGRLDASLIETAAQMVEGFGAVGASEEAQLVLRALAVRVSAEETSSGAAEALRRLLGAEHGARWARAIVDDPELDGVGLGEVVLALLEHVVDPSARARLVKRLSGLGAEALWAISSEQLAHADPRRLVVLLDAAYAADPRLGLKIAKVALRTVEPRAKDGVLRRLALHPGRDEVAVLAYVAGWKGERRARAVLGSSHADPELERRHQLTAVGALGLCRVPLAARPLLDLLTRAKLFSDAATDELRVAAAQALSTNDTAMARAALEEARQHKKKAVREVVERVLGGRG